MNFAGGVSLYLCVAFSMIAAFWDVRTRRIPNQLCAVIALTAIASSYLNGGLDAVGVSALHALAALVVGMTLFAIGFIGAGDAKMYSSIAFAIAPSNAFELLGWTSLAGLVLLASMAASRLASGKPLRENGKSFTVPYAVPISFGFILTILW